MRNKEDDEEEKDTTRVIIEPTKVTTTPTAIPDSSEPSNVIPDTSTIASVPSTIIHSTEPSIKCDDGYILLETECFIDYFIKAIYSSKANENIRLISDEYNLNKIRKMIIDGKTIKPTKNYTFDENGEHTIFFSFFPYNTSTRNEAIGIFNGIENLLNVEFSSYDDDYPDVSFIKMFNNCINLISVDFSKISIHGDIFTYDDDDIYYYYVMDYTFNNCINLKFVNFSMPINIVLFSTKFMFNNCISLTSINLSSFFYSYEHLGNIESSDLNNMFSNCISLKSIEFGDSISSSESSNLIHMSYMFYNCSSLTSVDLSLYKSLTSISDMSYIFAYCNKLKKIIFNLYSPNSLKTMSNAFRNCISLEYVEFSSFTRDVEDMSSLFYGCISLTSIYMEAFSELFGVNSKYMNYMFYDCRSLKSVNHLYLFNKEYLVDFNTTNLKDISYMFSGCSSLTSIDLSKFITKNVKNYEGLFYNCPKLEYIDISPFTHNNLTKSNLSIFNYNYPLKGTIYINEDFLKRIDIPSTLQNETNNNND